MEIVLKQKNVEAFLKEMAVLEKKFNNVYVEGELCDYVKLDNINGRTELTFVRPTPEMVRVACNMVFVTTLI